MARASQQPQLLMARLALNIWVWHMSPTITWDDQCELYHAMQHAQQVVSARSRGSVAIVDHGNMVPHVARQVLQAMSCSHQRPVTVPRKFKWTNNFLSGSGKKI